jgi:hypothetical protein
MDTDAALTVLRNISEALIQINANSVHTERSAVLKKSSSRDRMAEVQIARFRQRPDSLLLQFDRDRMLDKPEI